jgi:hypothetical protein
MKKIEIVGRVSMTLIGLFIIFMGMGVTTPLYNGYVAGLLEKFAIYMGMVAVMILGFYTIYRAWTKNKQQTKVLFLDNEKEESIIVSKYPIQLTESEVEWIKFCKGHYNKKYKISAKDWIESMKPLFLEKYQWRPDEHYNDYLDCMFKKLLDVYLKIADDRSGNNVQLKEIIEAGFENTYRRDHKLPIERVIAELCGQIQSNIVIEDGVKRYIL